MNDAVGGVEVTVQQDISFPKAGVNLTERAKSNPEWDSRLIIILAWKGYRRI